MEHQLKFAGSKLAKSTNRIPASHGSLRTATDQRRKDLGWIREPLRRRGGTRCGCTGARSVWGVGRPRSGIDALEMPSSFAFGMHVGEFGRSARVVSSRFSLLSHPGWLSSFGEWMLLYS